ncbi:TadE/TadG family type IV pilus assembly protein [Actinomycetota bacterium]
MKKKHSIFRKENGASAVEFALVLPLLVVLIFGIFQFGIAYNNYIALTHAAREGARLAAVNMDEELGRDIFDARIRDSAPTVTIDDIDLSGEDGDIGDSVEVTVTGQVLNIEIPLAGSWPVTLTSTATLRIEK